MASEQQAIGMMQGAFFVPKGDLISWVNNLLSLQITKIEQLGTGAVYCQILDSMFPGKIPMQRVNWRAKNQWQFINNYKILQQSFAKCKVQKHIDIEKLAKSKYQDNLQFMQWMKRYYDLFNKTPQGSYDPEAARKNAQVDFSFVQYRNPIKKKQMQKLQASMKSRAKSRSPYDKIKPRINNRSVTIGKYQKSSQKGDVYIQKLTQIRNVLKNGNGKAKDEQSINKIMKIMQSIEQDLPPVQEQTTIETKMETVPSKPSISQRKIQRAPTKRK